MQRARVLDIGDQTATRAHIARQGSKEFGMSRYLYSEVREFNREMDEMMGRCDRLASQFEQGLLTTAEFDAECGRILGEDYDPDECIAGINPDIVCDCPVCSGDVVPSHWTNEGIGEDGM